MNDAPPPTTTSPTALAEEFRILPYLVALLEDIQTGDSAAVSRTAAALNAKVARTEEVLAAMPGGEMNTEAQVKKIKELQETLRRKQEQLESYKSLPIFKEQAPEEDPHEEAQN